MAKTYLDVVNVVLRDINEVPLTDTNFGAARGLQSFVKEAVNRALLDVVNYNDEWPWLMDAPITSASPVSHTITTVDGQREYELVDIDSVDWNTVTYTDEDGSTFPLKYVNYDYIANSLPVPNSTPRFVYRPMNDKYLGVYPTPDKVLNVNFITWKAPIMLTDPVDELPFDERWYTVVVSRARYYAWMFRENPQQAQIADREYDRNIKLMFKKLMLPSQDVVRAV